MGSVTYHLRKQQLLESINNHNYEKLKLNTKKQYFTNFSNIISNGYNLSPSALSSVGAELYGVAADVMEHANDEATEDANNQLDRYLALYNNLGEEEYNQRGYSAQAAIYCDEDGNIDTDAAWQKFYESAVKSYMENEILPLIQEKEKELQEEQARLEALVQQEEAELDSVKQAEDSAIKNEAARYVA